MFVSIKIHLMASLDPIAAWEAKQKFYWDAQVKLSIFGRIFVVTLIGRRSRHYAGTRWVLHNTECLGGGDDVMVWNW